jgi:hypothetical protein
VSKVGHHRAWLETVTLLFTHKYAKKNRVGE